jgi:hypothetical protein
LIPFEKKRCAYCLTIVGLVEYKRWEDLYFCSRAHLQEYCKERQQEGQMTNLLAWLIPSSSRSPPIK